MIVVIETTAGFTCATSPVKSGSTARGDAAGGFTGPVWACAEIERPVRAVLASNAAANAVRRQGVEGYMRFSMDGSCHARRWDARGNVLLAARLNLGHPRNTWACRRESVRSPHVPLFGMRA